MQTITRKLLRDTYRSCMIRDLITCGEMLVVDILTK